MWIFGAEGPGFFTGGLLRRGEALYEGGALGFHRRSGTRHSGALGALAGSIPPLDRSPAGSWGHDPGFLSRKCPALYASGGWRPSDGCRDFGLAALCGLCMQNRCKRSFPILMQYRLWMASILTSCTQRLSSLVMCLHIVCVVISSI